MSLQCQRCDRDAFYIEVRPWIDCPPGMQRIIHIICTRCARRLDLEKPVGYRFKVADADSYYVDFLAATHVGGDVTAFEINQAMWTASRIRMASEERMRQLIRDGRGQIVVTTKQFKRQPISRTLRYSIFLRDEFTCQGCGRNAKKDGVTLHVDHMQPVSKGGRNDEENLWTLCEDCNLGKGARLS